MSENLKRAESLFNRIMNQGKEPPQFKLHIHKERNNSNGSRENHHNHHNHHTHRSPHNHNHNHSHHHSRDNHRRREWANHEGLLIGEKVLPTIQHQHILQYCWTFWHHSRYTIPKKKDDRSDYLQRTQEVEFPEFNNPNNTTKYIASLEQLWMSMSFLGTAKDVEIGTEYNFFKSGIHPAWEDPLNTRGGRWVFKLVCLEDVEMSRARTSLIWERLVLSLATGSLIQDPEVAPLVLNDINGVVLSVRKDEDIISIWNLNLSKNPKRPSNQIKRVLCEAVQRIIRECDSMLEVEMESENEGNETTGNDDANVTHDDHMESESPAHVTETKKLQRVIYKYRLHADYNTEKRQKDSSDP